ncbi:MAG: hypothetical protein U0S50_16100 [Sphingopyxis sp.]|uniref:hypothetical protein n=1 Tax=Sphingopyxis sp. TaxID=1908224 RepID=UPI002ABB5663|nr:hypothetical protein [Sphingopyxis sp.]MDZ3833319.1 hypothetical protein [Sphingopyxis sp.]
MLIFAIALTAGTQISGTSNPTDADIVVIARRMTEVKVTLGRNNEGKIICATTQSSGIAAIDEMICRDAAACLKRRDATPEQIETCIAKRKPRLVKRIVRHLKAVQGSH